MKKRNEFRMIPLDDSVKKRITGNSYPAYVQGDIAYEDLRHVTVWHIDFLGQEQKGEFIVNKAIAEDVCAIFYNLYQSAYPIEKIRLAESYGCDDEASMADNNTSAFHYRLVVGMEELSKHSFGLAIDVNPLYNPYIKDGVVMPANALEYVDREKEFPYKIDEYDLCYQLFKEHSFAWGGDWADRPDYQHFYKEKYKKGI